MADRQPKKLIHGSLPLILLQFVVFMCLGWTQSWDALRSAAGTIESVQAEFVQEKHLAILAEPLVSHGAFYYQAPGSLRWEYRRPVESVLLMHDGRIRRFIRGNDGFREESGGGLEAMQVVMDQIADWLRGRFTNSTMFDAQLQPSGRIRLSPKEKALQQVIQAIDIHMARQPGIIREVVIHESPNDYTRMHFMDTVLNQAIDPDVFRKVK